MLTTILSTGVGLLGLYNIRSVCRICLYITRKMKKVLFSCIGKSERTMIETRKASVDQPHMNPSLDKEFKDLAIDLGREIGLEDEDDGYKLVSILKERGFDNLTEEKETVFIVAHEVQCLSPLWARHVSAMRCSLV